jgi:HlyD family secretion protein
LQAQAAVQSAQARVNLMLAGARPSDVVAAQAQLDAAQAKLTQFLSPSPTEIAAAESALTAAQVALQNAESTAANARSTLVSHVYLNCSLWGFNQTACHTANAAFPLRPEVVDTVSASLRVSVGALNTDSGNRAVALLNANTSYKNALANVTAAEEALRAAQAKRQALDNPPAADVAALRSAVETARSNLENKLNPYTDADVQTARAALSQAQAALTVARSNLDQTVLRAPFDGVISARLLSAGAVASPTTPVLTLIGHAVEVHIAAEDVVAAQLKPGHPVEVSVGAFSGKTFRGEVAAVAPTGDARTHLFDVRVLVNDPDAQLRAGMAARVGLLAATR